MALEEQAVPGQPGDLKGHRAWTAPQGTRNLAIAHAPNDHGEYAWKEFRALEVVARPEGLCTKSTTAVSTSKALDALGSALSTVKAFARKTPVRRERVVEGAVGIGTVVRCRSLRL